MSLKEKLQQDLNSALKAHEDLKRLVLSTLLSVIHNKEIEKRTVQKLKEAAELTDEETLKVIQSEIKKEKRQLNSIKKVAEKNWLKKKRTR